MSDKNDKKREICPTELDLSDKNDNKTQDMSDRGRYVRQKLHKNARYVRHKLNYVGQDLPEKIVI